MIKGDKLVSELCKEFDVAQSQAYAWKQQLEEYGNEIFVDKRKIKKDATYEQLLTDLEQAQEECNFLARVLSR